MLKSSNILFIVLRFETKYPFKIFTFFSEYEGIEFLSGVKYKQNIGLQFHPERSGEIGLHLLNKLINNLE